MSMDPMGGKFKPGRGLPFSSYAVQMLASTIVHSSPRPSASTRVFAMSSRSGESDG